MGFLEDGKVNIPKLITENYEIAQSKGFYSKDTTLYDHMTGITEEIGECSTAHRNEMYANADMDMIDVEEWDIDNFIPWYKKHLSGTLEDELIDLFIRLLNLAGHYVDPMNYDVVAKCFNADKNISNVPLTKFITQLQYGSISRIYLALKQGYVPASDMGEALKSIYMYCMILNIPFEKHLQAKMAYNKTREHLHGKVY